MEIVQARMLVSREVEGFGYLTAGKLYGLPRSVARTLVADGDAESVGGQIETAAVAPPEQQAATGRAPPKHIGGGYYEVGGERMKGKKAAYARAAELAE